VSTIFIIYVIVTLLTVVANAFSATLDFMRDKDILAKMAEVNVPESWAIMLGALKAAGALGLLIGIWAPLIGKAAAVGLILFFIGAAITHLRVRHYSCGPAILYLLLAMATLVLRRASS
jgi:uncharacterized membrane protein YphA (DoxX/SURF4 family)